MQEEPVPEKQPGTVAGCSELQSRKYGSPTGTSSLLHASPPSTSQARAVGGVQPLVATCGSKFLDPNTDHLRVQNWTYFNELTHDRLNAGHKNRHGHTNQLVNHHFPIQPGHFGVFPSFDTF
jgi:hypothetical protein